MRRGKALANPEELLRSFQRLLRQLALAVAPVEQWIHQWNEVREIVLEAEELLQIREREAREEIHEPMWDWTIMQPAPLKRIPCP